MPNVTGIEFGTPFYAYADDAARENLTLTEAVTHPGEVTSWAPHGYKGISEEVFAALSAELGL